MKKLFTFFAMLLYFSGAFAQVDTIPKLIISEWRGDGWGSAYMELTNVGDTAAYTNTGLTNDTTYYFVVTAAGAGGDDAREVRPHGHHDEPETERAVAGRHLRVHAAGGRAACARTGEPSTLRAARGRDGAFCSPRRYIPAPGARCRSLA